MHKLMEYICNELEEYERKAGNGKLSMQDIEYVDKLAHIKKDILSSDVMWDESNYGSYRSYAMDGRGYMGNSGARYARRDAMGRYSRDGGYSMADDDFKMEIEELMKSAPNDHVRQKLRGIMSEM